MKKFVVLFMALVLALQPAAGLAADGADTAERRPLSLNDFARIRHEYNEKQNRTEAPADEEIPDGSLRVAPVCGAEGIQAGDQFLVQIMFDGDNEGYLTYRVNGSFDPEMAELVAPVYKDDGFSIIYNEFSNEDGTFQFDAADLSIRGSVDNLLCSLLFKAKKGGDFVLDLADGKDGVAIGMTKVKDGKYMYDVTVSDLTLPVSGEITRKSTVIIEDAKPVTPYGDMAGYRWAEVAVGALNQLGILKGIADGELFEPGKSVTRAEFTAMLVRAAKLTGDTDVTFSDVAEDDPFAAEISTALKKGIITDDGDGKFRPNDEITRQEIGVMVYRVLVLLDKMDDAPDEYLADFPDRGEVDEDAVTPMASVVRARLIQGDGDGNLNPGGSMNRAEAASLIERMIVHIKLVL